MKKKTTIYDIAKKLNITAATVSRALNNQSDVSEATKELVLKTAQKMNYEQNKLALALKSGKSNNVGVIVPRVDTNFFGSVIRGIEQELNPHGYHIIICQTDGNEIKEGDNIEALLNAQVDGILISTSSSKNSIFERILKKDVPLIFFDRKKSLNNVSSVTINDFNGGYKATQHLIDTGRTKIAHFSGDTNIEIFKDRFLGYKQALLDNNIDYEPDYVVRTESNLDDGKKAIKKLLSMKNPPDALFSASDFAALGAIQQLKEKGIKIPEDFSVIGFSNEPFTKFMELSISTIDQFPREMGKMTAKVFLEQINNTEKVKIEKKVILEPELIIRKSTSNPL
ncbi:LacI family DNA-binding transcriptional regulator [Flavobacterium sp. NRK F7]|uniref:LacI family DNA-binding transcriptional regulator n=1 Tax=Flavobacterium sp. NRK F7 TaxID=2954930 RepID=UPI002091CDE6|nr:LacI family DNA-binding transcriptional regulator [Flavobacterium sp. NRK F7]MCO6163395.1 LacI family transcriptional regulator [Flavobacterium sp. NRK F7]